jgi:hypothetical protein
MAIPLLDHLALSGRPDTDIDGAAVNFALTAFSEVRMTPTRWVLAPYEELLLILRSSCSRIVSRFLFRSS